MLSATIDSRNTSKSVRILSYSRIEVSCFSHAHFLASLLSHHVCDCFYFPIYSNLASTTCCLSFSLTFYIFFSVVWWSRLTREDGWSGKWNITESLRIFFFFSQHKKKIFFLFSSTFFLLLLFLHKWKIKKKNNNRKVLE